MIFCKVPEKGMNYVELANSAGRVAQCPIGELQIPYGAFAIPAAFVGWKITSKFVENYGKMASFAIRSCQFGVLPLILLFVTS